MKVLVTGSEGFVGRHLCKQLEAQGDEVIRIDIRLGSDILDCDLIDADRVYHLAAQTNALTEDARHDAVVNILGSIRIFSHYKNKSVYASSSMVNFPRIPYAISKSTAEHYAIFYGAAVVRLCNLFGAGGHSVIDRFEKDEVLCIYGAGTQVRTYAPVERAVDALMKAKPGIPLVLRGTNYSVLDLANRHPNKKREYFQRLSMDLESAPQL